MTPRVDGAKEHETGEPRPCRSCGTVVPAERHQADDGLTWIWRCTCGWASARTESGVLSRAKAREAIARALERLERDEA
ncbi:MAG: hypothetical protein IT378_15505 [Sandaracinaceae bacterium]|nr:hypothetical protein [Sandaracinaceae bacterium]